MKRKTEFIGVRLLPEERQTLCALGAGEHPNISETVRRLIREVGRK